MRLRRAAVPVLLWCLATAASIGIASLALRPVLRAAVPVEPLPAEPVEARGHRELVTQPPAPPPRSGSTPPPAPGRSTTTATPAASRTPTATGASPTPKLPSAPPSRVVDGWTVTTGADGIDTYLKSFRTEGGDAVIRIRDGVVSLVTATPRDGYSVSRAQNEPTRMVVQFVAYAGNVAYLVDAMWWQGTPHGTVTRIGG